ncbi:MAG: hypothetical protein AB8G86_27880 [Saprospiraceae bacterium]
MRHFFLLFSLLTGSYITGFTQSKILQELKDSNAIQLQLFFTPSTLRMLNLQDDSGYNEMVRGVDKLHFYLMNPTRFSNDDYFDTAERLIKEEAYEEFIIWDGNGNEFQVLGKPTEKDIIGIASYAERHYIFNLKGTIDLMKLPDIYEKMTTQDSTMDNGIGFIVDMIKDEDENRIRREKRHREWEERRRKEKEEAQIRTDSIRLDSINNIKDTNKK